MSHRARLVVTVAAFLATLMILQLRSMGEPVPIRQPLASLPTTVGAWHGRAGATLDEDVLVQLKHTDYLVRNYADGAGRLLNLYIGYWDARRKGVAIHSPKNCLPGAGWLPVESTLLVVPLGPQHPAIEINRYVVQKGREQQVVLYWYHSQGRAIAGEIPARFAMFQSAITRNRTDGAIVRVASSTYDNTRDASDRLVSYVQALYPLLGEYLPE